MDRSKLTINPTVLPPQTKTINVCIIYVIVMKVV